jgi:hypothetical protein
MGIKLLVQLKFLVQLLILLLVVVVVSNTDYSNIYGQKRPQPTGKSVAADASVRATTENLRLITEVITAAEEYRRSLSRVADFYAADVARAKELVDKRERLVAQGIIAPRDLAQSRQDLQLAETRLTQVTAEILTADNLLLETEAARQAILTPQPEINIPQLADNKRDNDENRYQVRPTIIRYNGLNNWVIDEVVKIEQFYQTAFQRALPISARGQTTLHDKLGFDHRESIDVAVHPDTPEGRQLLEYLRQQGIPFLAFSGAQAGVATGAHIHIGRPSPRIKFTVK